MAWHLRKIGNANQAVELSSRSRAAGRRIVPLQTQCARFGLSLPRLAFRPTPSTHETIIRGVLHWEVSRSAIRSWLPKQDPAVNGRPTSDRPLSPMILKIGRIGILVALTSAIWRPWLITLPI